MIDVLPSSIGIIICEQTSICKLFWLTEHSNSLFLVIYIKAFILVFTFQRSPFSIPVSQITFKLSFIKLLTFIYFNPLSLFQIVYIEPIIQSIPLLLDALPISKAILKIADINPVISIVHSVAMRFSIFPLAIIILKPNIFFYLIDPYHFTNPRPSVIHEIAYIEIPIFIYLHSTAISLIEEQLPFIDLPLMANNQPLSMSLPIHYCSYIQLIIIDRYLWTSESLEICKGGRVAFQRAESHEVFRNVLVVCRYQLSQISLSF